MYKVTCKLQTSFGVATQELFTTHKPTVGFLTMLMDDLVLDKTVLGKEYVVGLWQSVRFQADSHYAGEILVEEVKVCEIAQ